MMDRYEQLLAQSELKRRELQEKLLLAEKHAKRLEHLLREQQGHLDKIAQREKELDAKEAALIERSQLLEKE